MTASFPELQSAEFFRGATGLFDGEIVCLDDAGKPVFTDVMGRLQAKGEHGIPRSATCSIAFTWTAGRSSTNR